MELEGSLTCFQKPAIDFCPESSLHNHVLFIVQVSV
jgi:hypothetical protein